MTAPVRISPTLSPGDAAGRRWDAVIVGAGPAGSAAAMTLARAGRRTLLIDRAEFPRWKVCGCCLSVRGVAVLRALGIERAALRDASPLRSLDLACGRARASLPISGVAVSREALDAALLRAAIDAGSDFLDQTAALSAAAEDGEARLDARHRAGPPFSLRGGLILSGDGLSASLGPLARPARAPAQRIGLGATVAPRHLPPGAVSMTIARRGYVGAVHLPDGRLNIAAAVSPRAVREYGSAAAAVEALLRSAGHAWAPLARAARWRGTPALTRARRRIATPGLLFLGDSAGYVEPFTGEGITWALRCGAAAGDIASAILAGKQSPDAWQRWWDHAIRPCHRRCRLVALALRAGPLTRLAVHLLGAAPRRASTIVNLFGSGPAPALP